MGRAETRGDICLLCKQRDHEAESTVLISDLRSTRPVQQCPGLQVASRIARWLLQYRIGDLMFLAICFSNVSFPTQIPTSMHENCGPVKAIYKRNWMITSSSCYTDMRHL